MSEIDTSKEHIGEWVQHLRAKDEDGDLAWGEEGLALADLIEALAAEMDAATERAEKSDAEAARHNQDNYDLGEVIAALRERAEKAEAGRDDLALEAAAIGKALGLYAEWLASSQGVVETLRARVVALEGAAREYRHAMEGFAEAVRYETGKAYPWPAQDTARAKLDSALSAPPTPAPGKEGE